MPLRADGSKPTNLNCQEQHTMNIDKAVNISQLTAKKLNILKDKGTEQPFTVALLHNEQSGEYTYAACGSKLFG